jgi:alpha-mannosidase
VDPRVTRRADRRQPTVEVNVLNLESCLLASVASSILAVSIRAQDAPKAADVPLDLAKQPTLFVVGYAHLDTQWRWTYPQTIREFLANTLHDNFKLIERYPDYVFNFTGARRYQFFKEYYPAEWEQLKSYVSAGRWFPAGSSVDENDCNMPSGESLVRQVLYGNRFFRRELGAASEEYMLPDCFGFPAALPSILAHCGVKGFSTQKLTWNAVVPIPFKVGVWEGPDGRSVIAALDPGEYVGEIKDDLATDETWLKRIRADGDASGVYADFHYYGTGDVGGAPKEASVQMLEKSLETKGPVRVVGGRADAMFRAIPRDEQSKLPRYKGELELTEHSAGSLTSQAFMKRMNRKNELLADAAEKASVAAAWLGGREYPAQKLEAAWTLVLGSQMHDIVSGTALAKGYEYAWNDEILAANQFASVLEDAAGVVAGMMSTKGARTSGGQADARADAQAGAQSDGLPLVVFNPLSLEREDVVEAALAVDTNAVQGVRVTGPDGKQVPAQILDAKDGLMRIAFLAKVPPVGFAVFTTQLHGEALPSESSLQVDEHRLESERYTVKIDDNGDVASIFDRKANRELLSAPARLGLHYENPRNWPAWNQDWTDRQLPAKEFFGAPARLRVVERGPARVAVEIARDVGGTTITERVRLSAGGASDRVEFDTDIAWATRERSLRAAFPLTAANPNATYDIQLGTLERPNAHAKQYEYGFQQWFDLTDAKGEFGAAILCDSKYGSDKPDDHTLRLTLLHTPGTRGGYEDQGTQDIGRHRVLYALCGHAGDWRQGKIAQQASRLNQPLLAFRAEPHDGALGTSFSFLSTSYDEVRVQAIKKIEDENEIVVRLRELSGKDQKGVRIHAAGKITSAREVDGQEREIGPARIDNGEIVTDVHGYGLRAFALKLADSSARAADARRVTIALGTIPHGLNADVASTNTNRSDGAFDSAGRTLPAEQLPPRIAAEEASFALEPTRDGERNAVACRGQKIELPPGTDGCDRVYLLAAADAGAAHDVHARVRVGDQEVPIIVPAWTGFIGQWDHRSWRGESPEVNDDWSGGLAGIEPAYVERTPVAWFATHHHEKDGDAFYEFSYLYKIAVDLPAGARAFTLPDDPRIMVLAATAVQSPNGRVTAATPLADALDDHAQDAPRVVPGTGAFEDQTLVRIEPRLYWRTGSIRYTLDGSAPSASSPAYTAAFYLDHKATIRAAVVESDGQLGPACEATLDVRDVTPPTATRVTPAYGSPIVRVAFSEPVDDSVLDAAGYTLEPRIAVRSVSRSPGTSEVMLALASPLAVDTAYRLSIHGVKDTSPAHNAMKPASFDLRVAGPVFSVERVSAEQMGHEMRDVPHLPVKAQDAWTLCMFVRPDKPLDDRTIIAGFGRCEQAVDGGARYMAKFSRGVRFWSHNRDVDGRTPLDVGKWQMLAATYDGKVLRVYKDAKKIGERSLTLSDDDAIVSFAPLDPWEHKRRFEGEIRGFTVWSEALSDDALRSLNEAQ